MEGKGENAYPRPLFAPASGSPHVSAQSPVTICCEIWKLLPPEEQEFLDEAESLIVEITSDQQLTNTDIKGIINLHFPNWTLLSWWTPDPNKEGEF